MPDLVRLDHDGAVAVIRLDRPPVNAINAAMHAQLREVSAAVSDDADVRAVVLHGGERAFAAGADISEMVELSAERSAEYSRGLTDAIDAVARIRQPVIAAINRYALGGGCELALAADFRVIGEDALIGLPEITLGVIPGGGGTQRLPRLVGRTAAKELIFGGRPVHGAAALRLGLVSRAVPADRVYGAALEWAKELAAGPTAALAAAKAAVDAAGDGDLVEGLRRETALFAGLFAGDDQRTGMRSFLESGPGHATFTGR